MGCVDTAGGGAVDDESTEGGGTMDGVDTGEGVDSEEVLGGVTRGGRVGDVEDVDPVFVFPSAGDKDWASAILMILKAEKDLRRGVVMEGGGGGGSKGEEGGEEEMECCAVLDEFSLAPWVYL